MNKLLLITVACGTLTVAGFANEIKPAQATLDCNQIEAFGRTFKPQLIAELNREVAGSQYRINKRKQLRINRVEDLALDGCRIQTKTNVTLKRKVRRDAHGTVGLRGELTTVDLAARRVCYRDAKVTSVNLSNTTKLGEGIYKWVANKVLPNNRCLDI